MRKRTMVVGLVTLAFLGSTACITKKVYRKDMAQTDTRITGVESSVEQNEKRLTDLGKDTD